MVLSPRSASINNAELRPDGWWLTFEEGEEAGPFQSLSEARDFLDFLDLQQQAYKEQQIKKAPPSGSDANPNQPRKESPLEGFDWQPE